MTAVFYILVGLALMKLFDRVVYFIIRADMLDPDSFSRKVRRNVLTKQSDARFSALWSDVDGERERRRLL
jgi:hypothetical protein